MYLRLVFVLTSALTVVALPQTATQSGVYLNQSFSSGDLVAIDSIISALNSYAVNTATPTGAVTRTAEGFVSLSSGTPTFTDIVVKATSSAAQTVLIPDLEMEIIQYINPIQNSTAYKRSLSTRGQGPIDVCPKPKTITVIEWVDCKATPISCDVCPVKKPCDCEEGYEWVIEPTPTSSDLCTTTNDPCTTTTAACPTCPGGIEYIIIAIVEPSHYKYKRPCSVCPGGYEYIVADGSDCGLDLLYVVDDDGQNDYPPGQGYENSPPDPGRAIRVRETDYGFAYSGTVIVSSQSRLVVSTEFPLLAAWSSQLTWPPTPSTTQIPAQGTAFK
jgi:hypothetical protein